MNLSKSTSNPRLLDPRPCRLSYTPGSFSSALQVFEDTIATMLGIEHLALRESFNRRLTLTALLIAVSQFNFGFDQQGFASTQSMNAFDKQFGQYNAKKHTYVLPTVWLSYFNGFNYITFGFGTAPRLQTSYIKANLRKASSWAAGSARTLAEECACSP